MMRKLPDCPRCQEDELWMAQIEGYFRVACYECGWSASRQLADGQDIDLTIAELIKTYADWLERARQIDPGDEMPPLMLLALLGQPPATPIAQDNIS